MSAHFTTRNAAEHDLREATARRCHNTSWRSAFSLVTRALPCFLCLLYLDACLGTSLAAAERPNELPGNSGRDVLDLFVAQPTVRPNPIERAPLIAIVDFETTKDVNVAIEVADGRRMWRVPWDSSPKSKHSIPVLGLRPGLRHKLSVIIETEAGEQQTSEPLFFTTPILPDDFPPLRTLLANPSKMERGVTLFAANIWRENRSMLDYGFIIALDAEGEVIWYCKTEDRIADMRVTQRGTLLYQQGSYRYAYEIDLLGRDYQRWVATNLTYLPDDDSIPVEADTMHHDLLEIPRSDERNGNFLTLSTELRHFQEYPTSEFDPQAPWAPAYVVCDRILEFDPADGQIQNQLHLTSLLDPRRFGYMALSGFWKDKYNYLIGEEKARDWSHANALLYLPEEDAVIVSFRHLDCLYKIDWKTKEIIWIFGDPRGWGKAWQKYLLKPIGNLQWPYHQHAPQLTPNGNLMMYDNGNYRARPFFKATKAPQNRSRVVEFAIDEEAMTVEQVFQYDGGSNERFYCPFYCEADWLPQTRNILITDGGHIELANGTPSDDVPAERQWARIFEVTRQPPHQKVFEVVIDSGMGSRFGWSIYRSMRRSNLYDGFLLKAPQPDEQFKTFSRKRHIKRQEPLNATWYR